MLETWFSRLPIEIVNTRPRLLLALGLLRERQCRWGEALAALWSEDIVIWRQGGGRERDKGRGLKVIAWFVESTADRSYEILDRRFFDGGFVQQHIVHATVAGPDGTDTPLSFRACLVVTVGADGLITRIDEYLDPADLAPLTGA